VARLARPAARRLAGRVPRGRATLVHAGRDQALAGGVRAALLRVQPVQAVRAAERAEGAGGSLSPRGDWRAPSDMSARIWLDEIHREIPADWKA
jgi:hypothetical protein